MSSASYNSIQIGPVGGSDAGWMAVLHDQCFPEPSTEQSLGEILTMAGAFGLAARHAPEGPAIGFAIGRVAADESELLLLGVIAPERRQGVATELLRQVCEHVRVAGCRHLFLEVAETNQAAQALYRAQGFTVVGRRPNYYCVAGQPPVAALTLRRTIRARRWRWFGSRE